MSRLLVNIYFGYSLVIGITSQRMVDRKFKSTFFTRLYALFSNITTLVFLPIVMWYTSLSFEAKHKVPQLIYITFNVKSVVSYVLILYTILSRGFRDTAIREIQPLIEKLFVEEKHCVWAGGKKPCIRQSLRIILYVKYLALAYLCFTEAILLFYSNKEITWLTIANFVFLSNAYNIQEMVPMGFFLALWHIARGFDYVNRRLDEIITSKDSRNLKEVRRLWLLHAELTKSALRVNKIYGPQMLANRFNNFVFGVIQAYWGAFFTFEKSTSFYWVVYGSVGYLIRSLDFYLVDYMCDLVVRYQGSAKHAWSESRWTKEISSYVTYASSSKLELWTCGLFPVNRSLWFDMITSILYYILMLLQFHIVIGK
ncbi:putative gustatory receptor 59b [Drosophila ficusphila]|uniref:putative gustatory receptor 59b n=1 Tax=Drosophila ficusphila TaxID=30025 RepID=UPI0007E60F2E|nr:putative gustatory receptor 59b [Drosophila ficusphila]